MEIKIKDLISKDIRSRYNGNILRAAVDGEEGQIVLDFSEVEFITRSFADELYNIVSEKDNLTIENMSDFVGTMYDTVRKGRQHGRRPVESNAQMLEFKDMKSLSEYLKTF